MSIIFATCILVYLLAALVQFAISRRVRRFVFAIVAMACVFVLGLLVRAGATGRVSFGGEIQSMSVIAIMFLATLLGIGARYIFFLQKNQFAWLDFVKPLCITPIVLLPLIGSVQGLESVRNMQVVSFGLLAFQNGFFWQVILESVKPKLAESAPVASSKVAADAK